MAAKLREIVKKYVGLGTKPDASIEDQTSAAFTLIFGPPSWVLFISLMVVNYFQQHDYRTIYVYGVSLILLIFNYLYLVLTKNVKVVNGISSFLAFVLVYYIFFDMGFFGGGYIWLTLFPVVVLTVGGFIWGLYWITFLFFSLLTLIVSGSLKLIQLPYPAPLLAEVLVVIFFAAIFSLFRQYLIERSQADFEKYKIAVDNASDHIIITDPDAHILYANPAASKITGYANSEMMGETPALWGNHMPKEFYEKMWKVIKTDKKTFYSEDLSNKRKNGEVYQASLSISPALDGNGNIRFFIGIERDITAQKQSERLKSEFVSLVSHQLRTPMTEIKWTIEMLNSEDGSRLSEEQKTHIANINQSNQYMIDLVNSLLNISRLEMGRVKIEPKLTNLLKLAQDTAKQLGEKIKEKEIKMSFEEAGGVPEINIDPKLTTNVLLSLMSNAIRYTPKGGSLVIGVKKDGDNIVTSIKDTGIGIPAEDQKHIFERFFRASNVGEGGGTGLGLYLAREIMLAAGGKIWFESTAGKGSTFSFSYPLTGTPAKAGEIALS